MTYQALTLQAGPWQVVREIFLLCLQRNEGHPARFHCEEETNQTWQNLGCQSCWALNIVIITFGCIMQHLGARSNERPDAGAALCVLAKTHEENQFPSFLVPRVHDSSVYIKISTLRLTGHCNKLLVQFLRTWSFKESALHNHLLNTFGQREVEGCRKFAAPTCK